MDRELDDIVERSFGYQFLTDASYAGSMMAGLMTEGSIQAPPQQPTSPREFDPRQVLEGNQHQIRQRLQQISPAAGHHFVGMWQGIAEHELRTTPVSDTFNNARETISALSDVLVTAATAKADRSGDQLPPKDPNDGAAWNRALLTQQLGLPPEISASWGRMKLHPVAHRDGLGMPRKMTEELIDLARLTEEVALGLVDLYERNIDVVFDEVDRMLHASPHKAEAKRLAHLAPPEHDIIRSFFDRLDNPEWWSPLRTAKFFADPPQPSSPVVHPRWPQSRYLARIAPYAKNPADLAHLLMEIARATTNVRVHEDLLRAAAALPPKYATKVLGAEAAWPKTDLHFGVERLVGEAEIVRYPAWYGSLLLHIATHQDSSPADREKTEEALRSLLRVTPRRSEEDTGLRADELLDSALQQVLLHIETHATGVGKDLTLQILSANIDEVSTSLIETMADESPSEQQQPTKQEPALTALDNWFKRGGDITDRSHLLIPSVFSATSRSDYPALSGLLMGYSSLLADAITRGTDPALLRNAGGTGGDESVRTYTGLRDRAYISALLLAEPLQLNDAKVVLCDYRLARSAAVRGEFIALLRQTWAQLSPQSQQAVRASLGTEVPDPVSRLIAWAPMVGLDPAIPDDDAFARRARAVTGRPGFFLSVAQGQPDPYADSARTSRTPTARNVGFDLAALRAEELHSRDSTPSSGEWAEAIKVVARRRSRVGRRVACSSTTHAKWLRLIVGWLAAGAWPDGRLLNRLIRFAASVKMVENDIDSPSFVRQIGHHGLRDAESDPNGQILYLRLVLLVTASARLTRAQRDRLISSLKHDLGRRAPGRATRLTVLGAMLYTVHSSAPDVWVEVVVPLLRDLPDLTTRTDETVPTEGEESRDAISALYSGLTMDRGIVSPEFLTELHPFLEWVYVHLSELTLPVDLTPLPIVEHTFILMLSELLTTQRPGDFVEIALEAAPPLLSLAALRRFADLPVESSDSTLANLFRELWTCVADWANTKAGSAAAPVAAIGTWVSNPQLVEALGQVWMLEHIDRAVGQHGTLDMEQGTLTALAALSSGSSGQAESVVAIVLDLRNRGLLLQHHGDELAMLVEGLSGGSWPLRRLPELRSALAADRLIGPLARR